MDAKNSLGIIAENIKQRISIFDPDTQKVLQQLPVGVVVNDVAITRDCTRAFVSAFDDRTMFQIQRAVGHAEDMDTIGTYGYDVDSELEAIADAVDQAYGKLLIDQDKND